MVLINVYAPTEVANANDRDIFYDELERLFDRLPKYNSKTVLGNFNAKLRREGKSRPTIGKYSLHEKTTKNGEKLVNFAISKNLLLKSTYFEHSHTQIHMGISGRQNSQPDRSRISRKTKRHQHNGR